MNRLPEDEFKDLIAELRSTAPEPPPVHWGAYRAELREKLQRRASRGWAAWSGPLRPFQVAMAAGFGRVFEIVSLEEFRFDQGESDGHRHLGWSVLLKKPE